LIADYKKLLARCGMADPQRPSIRGVSLWIAGQAKAPPRAQDYFVWKMRAYRGYRDLKMSFKRWRLEKSCAALWFSRDRQSGYGWNVDSCEKKLCFICEVRALD